MTREEAIESLNAIREKFLKGYGEDTVIDIPIDGDDMQAFDMAISALSESDNVGMSMSHRAIAKVIDNYIANHEGDVIEQYTAHEIKTLLVSDDSDNKGEWIYDKGVENWRCSKCGQTPPPTGYVGNADFMATYFKFCPTCGADMREPVEEKEE